MPCRNPWTVLHPSCIHITPLVPQASCEANLDRLRLFHQWEYLKCNGHGLSVSCVKWPLEAEESVMTYRNMCDVYQNWLIVTRAIDLVLVDWRDIEIVKTHVVGYSTYAHMPFLKWYCQVSPLCRPRIYCWTCHLWSFMRIQNDDWSAYEGLRWRQYLSIYKTHIFYICPILIDLSTMVAQVY
jgi:hypothetical protein